MKRLKYIALSAILGLGGITTGCDTLDIDNLESYDAESVWTHTTLAEAYINNLYASCFSNWSYSADTNSDQQTGVVFTLGYINETSSAYKSWEYTNIRSINLAIQELEAGDLSNKEELLGQALFMRAYVYYGMVEYHGGVPYIKVPQDRDDDLYVERNSSKECFQYMIDDLDAAIKYLPEKNESSSSDYGRIDQCFAKAFKAKVLLLKASPLFNPSNMYDNSYWNEAYTAAKEAYDFCIAHGSALTENYADIWIKEGGPEVVFPVINSNPNKTSSYAAYTRPASIARGVNSYNPTWELVKQFPMLDGKSYDDPTGKYYVKDEETLLECFWKNRDPRFALDVLCNGQEYPVADKVAGYRQYNALGLCSGDDQYGINPAAHTNAVNNDVYTGFYNYKGADMTLTQSDVLTYDIDHILMRFVEVMFIYAEAANETGHTDVAIDILKQIRERAGIEAGDDGLYGMNVATRADVRQAILDERNIELCFEGHRFWDLRRARKMMDLNGLIKHGVEAIAINADGSDMDISTARSLTDAYKLTTDDFRYVIHTVPYTPAAEKEFVLEEKFYFFPIMKTYLDENPKLKQNKDWGGTFDPTMEAN